MLNRLLPTTSLFLLLATATHGATYLVAPQGDDDASGAQDAPWKTIQHAANNARPGDVVLIAGGTYRESVALRNSGTPEAPITFSALPGARVVITGADELEEGWAKFPMGNASVYVRAWPHVFAIDHINGKPVLTHPNDPEHELTGRAEQVIHQGRLLRQVLRPEQLAPGSFCADVERHRLFVWLRDGSQPGRSPVEASTRSAWITAPGTSHIRLRGITFRYAANFAQRGALSVGRASGNRPVAPPRGWIVEDCVFERANGPGASFSGEGHLFRRCIFQDNGQLGFGASYCHDSRMEECAFLRNNTKGFSTGWEAGGLKIALSRGFVFDRCRAIGNHGVGIWYDIGNEKAVVQNCYIADNDEAGLFYEISYSLHAHDNLIVNNANLGEDPGPAWGNGGITLSSSEDCILEHNTLVGNRDGIAFREQERSTPRLDGRRSVRVLNRNHVVRNNIIACSQAFNIAFWMDTNFFGAHPSGGERNKPLFEDPRTLGIRFENNLLWPLPGKPNYLYGATWRSKHRQFETPQAFSASTGIPDSSVVADPRFEDLLARDYRLKTGSPAASGAAGVRTSMPSP